MSNQAKKDCRTLIAVIISAFVYAIAMKAFVETGNLFPGGFAGLSRMFSMSLSKFGGITIPFSVFYFLLNIPPTLLVYKYVGHRFTMIQHNTAPTEHEHEEAEQQPEPFMMFPPSYPFHDLSFIVVLHPQFSFVCHKRDKARLLQTKPESTRFPAHVLVDLPIARSAGESGRRPLPRSRR